MVKRRIQTADQATLDDWPERATDTPPLASLLP